MIVGFPTETDGQFQELLDFVRHVQFDALGAFAFSREPDTPAATMPGQIDEEVTHVRLDTLMRTQRTIARRKARQWIGKTFWAYLEPTDKRKKYYISRNDRQAPEVDPVTLIKRAHVDTLSAGPSDKLRVKCVRTRDYDLIAEPVRKR